MSKIINVELAKFIYNKIGGKAKDIEVLKEYWPMDNNSLHFTLESEREELKGLTLLTYPAYEYLDAVDLLFKHCNIYIGYQYNSDSNSLMAEVKFLSEGKEYKSSGVVFSSVSDVYNHCLDIVTAKILGKLII
jgi:hypothetical protein